jgi:GDP-L-fucose synthase
MIKKTDRIFLAGHKGLVGSAILKLLKTKNYKNIVTINKDKLDLFDQKKVFNFLKKNKPKIVIIAAAKVGGIKANNQFRADFIRENLDIQNNLIHGSYINNIKNIIFLGSSCVYPKKCKQPIKEEYLLSGALEETNEPYAVAKIAGIKMCESYNRQYKTKYLCLMPSNTFGPGDNYNEYNSHFISAILKKIYLSTLKKKSFLKLWGSGRPKREIIYVDDLAEAVVYFMNKKVKHSLINIGTSRDMTIKNYAKYILKILNINLKIRFDGKKEFDGIKRKLLDISLAKRYGWKPRADLKQAIIKTYNDLTLNYKYYRH